MGEYEGCILGRVGSPIELPVRGLWNCFAGKLLTKFGNWVSVEEALMWWYKVPQSFLDVLSTMLTSEFGERVEGSRGASSSPPGRQ